MLKKISKLFLGLMVCASSACVTPTHASSAATVVLTHIQAGSPYGAKDEMVSIYNNTANPINISNWCIENKTHVKFVCFDPASTSLAYYLPAYSHIVAATEFFIASSGAYPEDIPFIFTPASQSSGSLVNSGDSVSLLNANNEVVDTYSWSATIPSGKLATRTVSTSAPYIYETLGLFTDWSNTSLINLPMSRIDVRTIEPPVEEPVEGGEGNPTSPTVQSPIIVEVFPNPKGSDVGAEYIEIYNPNADLPIDLSHYTLHIGQQLEKTYQFAPGTVLAPLEYRAFTNSEIKFTLLNSSSSVELRLDGRLVDDTISYTDPKEGYAWALTGKGWEYTNTPTPNMANSSSIALANEDDDAETESDKEGTASTQKPCAANQYRSPDTNRCRLIVSSASSAPAACSVNQYRSPETNRCRNIASTSSPAPCKEGQERNPETNRCRNIIKMSEAEHGIKGVSTQNDAQGARWYWWLAIGGVVALIIGYGIWEWREELLKVWTQVKMKFARIKP